MQFHILASNPIVTKPLNHSADIIYSDDIRRIVEDLSEAIESIFPMDTKDAFLVWNGAYIPINYKYDLSVLIDDLLPLLSEILNENSGSYEVEWGSDTFSADWTLDWDEERITIMAQWHEVLADIESLRNNSKIEMDLNNFLYEWQGLLRKVIDALKLVDIELIDNESLDTLKWVESSIPKQSRKAVNIPHLYRPTLSRKSAVQVAL
ncbi:MAG: hypothetical protein ACPGWR_08710 [Ardenticatenaceae bacterium]